MAYSSGIHPPLFHAFRKHGIFVFRFFKSQSWVYVIVDDMIPVDSKTKSLVYGVCRDKS